MSKLFVIVQWPESQGLMGLSGFDSHCYLVNDEHGMEEFGSSAYFVEKDWLDKMKGKGLSGDLAGFACNYY